MTNVEGKSAYPYITKFKKEPFKSFVHIKRREIGNYFFSEYQKLIQFYHHFNVNLFKDQSMTLESVFWILLLRKYLKEEKKKFGDEILNFIKKCAIRENDQLGFKISPYSQKIPDIYSTYLALSSLKQVGFLNEYLSLEGRDEIKSEIKDFILSHKKGNAFLHCHDKECDICKKISPARTLYYVFEILSLLGVEIRTNREQFRSYIGDRKKEPGLVFKLLCFKILDYDLEVKDKEIQYLQQFQKENGSFSYFQMDGITSTFWVVYVLDLYSWILDYNPAGMYRFINLKLNEILNNQTSWNLRKLGEVSKLIIILSIIWKKFIDEIERLLFKQLEKEKYVNLDQLKSTCGLSNDINELISYVNLNYNFNLRILDNKIEFKHFLGNQSKGKREFIHKFYEQVKSNSIVSLSDIYKKYKALNFEPLKLKEDIFPIIKDLMAKNFLKGNIRTKKPFLAKTKYYFYLNFLLDKIIVADTEINMEKILDEKEKLEDIRNDIYNMTLKLEVITDHIREEIESYLLINEIDYAKQRLKFVIRDAVMEADFLNENIENSFNEVLYYINVQTVLGSEIAKWNKVYSVLQNRLAELDSYLRGKIQEKEDLRNLNSLLENLKGRIIVIEEDLKKKLDSFRSSFSENLEKGYSDEGFNIIIQNLDNISQNVKKFDNIIYKVSQQIITKEKKILKKHKKVIDNWLRVKKEFESEFKFYTDGFQFFNNYLKKIEETNGIVESEIISIGEKAKDKIKMNQFQEAFDIIKKESDLLLNSKLNEIKEFQYAIKNEKKSKQKLYLLYKHLQDKLDSLESNIIDLIAKQVQSLKNKVVEERNRANINDFDDFVSQETIKFKSELNDVKKYFSQTVNIKIEDINKEFDGIQARYNQANKTYLKKLDNCSKNIEAFKEESKLTIIQWEKFSDFLNNEITVLRDEYINNIISNKINIMAVEKKTNYIKLADLKDDLKLSCKILIRKLKDMIDISKINAELNEDEKSILIFTDYYHLNKKLKNYVENQLLRSNRERIGKILGLYDSSIRNRTLNVNMLELQNRINELNIFEDVIPKKFYDKVNELQINIEREEFIETKRHFESILENNKLAITNIKNNLKLFNNMQNFIEQQYNSLNMQLKEYITKTIKETENYDLYLAVQENFEEKKTDFKEKLKLAQDKIEEQVQLLSDKTDDSNKLIPEIRESYVTKKNDFLDIYNNKLERITEQIEIMKNESFRNKLLDGINKSKIKLSQLLGNLERKVEINIEIREFKKINLIVQKRAKNIETEIRDINRNINTTVREFNKSSKNFSQISKFIIEDFDKFIIEYSEILDEKVKSLERQILKAYIDMTIKAVANEYLTVGFLNNELKVKKQNIQDHLLFLISEGELQGKYDPRFGIYYENPDVLSDLDENELEVIKNTNFRVYMFLNRLKNFTSQYSTVIAFIASIITISYYLFLFSGGNFAVIAFPIIIIVVVLSYYILKRRKEEKIK